MAASDGLLVVDKPSGWTSHDVVARCRRLAGTRKVGHAGTLDPMATGVLVLGIGRATRLLGYLSLDDKGYQATIRLGQTTVTDDADGPILETKDTSRLTDEAIHDALQGFRGDIDQVPSSVSAVKIKGRRAYKRVRDGEDVDLPARRVHIATLAAQRVRRVDDVIDVDIVVECSSGTYIRALARDLGALLDVGGHLTALRRTRVGGLDETEAHTLEELARVELQDLPVLALDAVARDHFAWCVVEDELVGAVSNGRQLQLQLRLRQSSPEKQPLPGFAAGERGLGPAGPVAVLAPGGRFLALYEQHGPVAKAVAVFAAS